MPRRYSMDQRAELTAATRARIIEAVRDILIESGPDGLTLQQVAERADLALRTLYNHFPNRAELLTATLFDLAARVRESTRQALDTDLGHPRDALRGYVLAVYQVYEAQAPWFEAILGVRGDEQLDRTVTGLRTPGQSKVTSFLQEAAAAGLLRVPTESAISAVSIHTLFPVWVHLTREFHLTTPQAAARVADLLDAMLFHSA